MGKIKAFFRNKWVGFTLASLLYTLWFVVWTGNLWMLLGLVVIFDLYISKFFYRYVWCHNVRLCQRSKTYKTVYEWVNAIIFATVVASLVQYLVKEAPVQPAQIDLQVDDVQGRFLVRWGKALWQLFWSTIPVYILAVLALGAARVWLFPHADGAIDNTLLWVVAMAVAGCLFVIPTAAEIPIVQTMMLAGMGTAPALALLITLPAISLPSLIMLRKSFPAKALWLTAGLVALSGMIVGSLALL